MEELPKPWFNMQDYKKVRLLEAKYEAEIARRFLEEGLLRNAAGKVYQAWKALVAAFATDYRDKLMQKFKGEVKIRGNKKVQKVDWIIAIMPSSLIKAVAQTIGGDIDTYTNIALLLHQYQYNGPDSQAILSQYINDESAKEDILKLLSVIDNILSKVLNQ
ncbi:PaREP1 family protein [Acidianus ambivalens]|uniref:PaREP1 domain containing protein n=1 Tax=Acidianus ambivalens TaxID=2283 RepID=A0A650CWH2_ACIAM|nr:PaREP1 family protein [Acidianus ambivalens]MQL56338.1 hypothetical protein [Acidianus ambivalens]QGR22035.1 hypothetical protein D1866_08520 [Acidianus ambivalens]